MIKRYTFTGALCAVVLLLNTVTVAAQSAVVTMAEPDHPVLLITEVQPASTASALQEFIEIYNPTEYVIDFSTATWKVDFTNSTATTWQNPNRSILLTGKIKPGEAYIVASEYKSDNTDERYLSDLADQWFATGMASTGGHVRIVYESRSLKAGECVTSQYVADQVEWSGTSNGILTTSSIDGRSIYVEEGRVLSSKVTLQRHYTLDGYADTDNDAADFGMYAPTPKVVPLTDAPSQPSTWQDDVCIDAPKPTNPDPEPSEPSETTTPPTDGSDGEGIDSTPSSGDPDTTTILSQPQITELLPNPASPQTDAKDEFIELYNPYDEPILLAGYTLETGETTKHRYVFPVGAVLLANEYKAFYITQTETGLSNGGGQARLYNAAGTIVAATDVYDNAPDGKSWAKIDGVWQWSALPTPSAGNAPGVAAATALLKPANPKKAPAVKAANAKAAKVTTPKATKPKQTKAVKEQKQVAAIRPEPEQRRPVHGGVLAAVGVIAVLYGAYEYRHDMANKIRQFRSNRTARRKSRASA